MKSLTKTIYQVREPQPVDDFAQDMIDDFAGVEEAMQKSFDKMSQDMAKMEENAGSDPNSNFQSYKSSRIGKISLSMWTLEISILIRKIYQP